MTDDRPTGARQAPDCTCGWGGVHDADNPRCQANGGPTLDELAERPTGADDLPARLEAADLYDNAVIRREAAARLRELEADNRRLATTMTGSTHTDLRTVLAYEAGLADADIQWQVTLDQGVAERDRLREAGDALAEMVRDVQPYLPSIPVARLDAALDRWGQTR